MHEIFRLSEHLWHIQEVEGTFFSIIKGDTSAIMVDTAYGIGENKAFTDKFLEGLPYRVILTHGHADHVQGAWEFEKAYINEADLPAYNNTIGRMPRISTFYQYMKNYNLPKEKKDEYIKTPSTKLEFLNEGQEFDLGGVHVKIVFLPGHTKGEIGLLIEEDRLLVAGDAFSEDCFMFADNHDSLETLASTCEKALLLPFDEYVCSHSVKLIKKEFLNEVSVNAKECKKVPGSEEVLLGKNTVKIEHSGKYGTSIIRIPA